MYKRQQKDAKYTHTPTPTHTEYTKLTITKKEQTDHTPGYLSYHTMDLNTIDKTHTHTHTHTHAHIHTHTTKKGGKAQRLLNRFQESDSFQGLQQRMKSDAENGMWC